MKFQGVLFFPVTPFATDGSLDEERLAQHIENGVAAGAGGVFVACGTGEFHALAWPYTCQLRFAEIGLHIKCVQWHEC